MMADGRAQILQVSPSATSVTPFLSVSATRLAVDLAEHLCAPPRVQSLDALFEFSYVATVSSLSLSTLKRSRSFSNCASK
jgi:hypothetical protein